MPMIPQMSAYMAWLKTNRYGSFSDYQVLHRWSVEHLENFWKSIWEWSDVITHAPFSRVLGKRAMPGTEWFPGAKLNFAENLLRYALQGNQKKIALTSLSESRPRTQLTYGELKEQVAAFATFLRSQGVMKGDRVVGITAHTPEPVIAMLAATSLGAIWSSCSPDFGAQGILDRFGQIEPKVLVAVNGYRYNGKDFSLIDRIKEVQVHIPSLQSVVIIPHLSTVPAEIEKNGYRWNDVLAKHHGSTLTFEPLPFDHPVYILYSSGTTGVPKCIVHGAGGTLLQHSKELMLHTDLNERDTFFYFTTCGWMMWNWQVSGLMTGAELIFYDGSPSHPSLDVLWKCAADEPITIFGTSAKFLGSCRTAGLEPGKAHDLRNLRTILSTGSPLLPEDFDWVAQHVKEDVLLSSISGGTDIVSCFVLGNPLLPVVRGEIQCKGLGMDVKAFSEEGKEVVGQKGELVCTQPAPSMPVFFWNDVDGTTYRKAYFERFPGVWAHGDWVMFNECGGSVIYGRSDATLNPGGVRIGTAEIYRQVETIEEVRDSLVIGQPWQGDERVILFVVLKPGIALDETLDKKIRTRIRENTTPRHVPAKIIQIEEIPYTISGKKVELAVKKILMGQPVNNRDALANPKSLDQFVNLPQLQ